MNKDNVVGFGSRKTQKMDNGDGFLPYVCEVCGCPFFQQVFTILKRSMFVSPNGQEEYQPTLAFRCENCGWILGAPYDEEVKKEIENRRKALMSMTKSGNNDNVEIIEEQFH